MRRLINIADKRTEFVVEIGLIPLRAELRSVIDTRDTGHREQQRIEIAQILLIPERRTGALDIMIVHKIQEIFSREERPRRRGKQAGHVVLDLKKVPGIVRREHAAEPLIICNGVEPLGTDVLLKIVGVDNFADQEKIRFLLIDRATQQLHKPRRKQVTHIQPQPVDPEFIDPETHSIHQIVLHILIIETQLDQLRMPFPVFIVQPVVIGGITAEINVEPKEIPLVLESRTFADVPVKAGLEGAPSDGYEVTNVTLQPSTLRIEGGSSIVASVTNLVTKPIPLDGRTESFDIMVATESVSQYIALPDKSSVKASVTIEPVEETKQFQTSITVRNLRSGLKIDSVLPLIDITVKGAQKSLERYSPSADAVYMDFSKITKGGTYDLPVIFSLPSYLELIAPTEKQTVSVVIKDSAVSQKVPAENKQAAEADNLPSTDGELTVTMTPVPAQEQ